MKNSLGKWILSLLVIYINVLEAQEYVWKVHVNKTKAYVNEAIYLHYSCEFNNSAELYVIEFNPTVDNTKYKIEILSEREQILKGRRVNEYEFVLFVKQAGAFHLSLDTVMKKTNKDSIENGVLGRDNANYEEFVVYPYKQEAIAIDILPIETDLVGSFVLTTSQEPTKIDAYAPYHISYEIKGVGDFQLFKDVNYSIEGVKSFSEPAKLEVELTKEGYKGVWKKKFAFVSDKNFTIPGFRIEYFDLQEQKKKVLTAPKIQIEVVQATFTPVALLDKQEEKSFTFPREYLYYFLSMVFGFLLGRVSLQRGKKELKEYSLCEKIIKMKSLEEAMVYLIVQNKREYIETIKAVERGEINSLSGVKKSLQEYCKAV